MTGSLRGEGNYISEIADIESKLAIDVGKAAEEVAHVECFDDEQRSEVYAILQTLKSDCETHRRAAELLADKLTREGGDA